MPWYLLIFLTLQIIPLPQSGQGNCRQAVFDDRRVIAVTQLLSDQPDAGTAHYNSFTVHSDSLLLTEAHYFNRRSTCQWNPVVILGCNVPFTQLRPGTTLHLNETDSMFNVLWYSIFIRVTQEHSIRSSGSIRVIFSDSSRVVLQEHIAIHVLQPGYPSQNIYRYGGICCAKRY